MFKTTINFRVPCSNFFQKNKYPVKIYRSGNFNHLSTSDFDYIVNNLKVKTYIDFRSHNEYSPIIWNQNAEINHIHLPIQNIDKDLIKEDKEGQATDFVGILEAGTSSFRSFFELLSEENSFPVVFGCNLGKDRTGVGAYLLLKLLGVTLSEIESDYLMSNINLNRDSNYLRSHWEKRNLERTDYLKTIMLTSEMFKYQDQKVFDVYGGIENYYEKIGITSSKRITIIENILKHSE